MKKNFEKYVAQVKGLNNLFSESVKRISEELNAKLTDWRLSEKGREEQRQKKIEELNAVCENMSNVFREAVRHFLTDYEISLPDDGEDHSKDIENALRVIEMLSFDLDTRNIDNILNPLRGNFRAMKTVLDVMRVKNESGLSGLAAKGYRTEVMNKLMEYTGTNNRVNDFLEIMDNIGDILESPIGYRFEYGHMSNATVIEIVDIVPYSYLSCADWMKDAGELYAQLEKEFASLFDKHTPTDREMLESSLPGKMGRA